MKSLLICGIIGAFLMSVSCSYAAEADYTPGIEFASDDAGYDVNLATTSATPYTIAVQDVLHSFFSFDLGQVVQGGVYKAPNSNAELSTNPTQETRAGPLYRHRV